MRTCVQQSLGFTESLSAATTDQRLLINMVDFGAQQWILHAFAENGLEINLNAENRCFYNGKIGMDKNICY